VQKNGSFSVSLEDLLKYLAARAAGSTEEPSPELLAFLVARAKAHPRHPRTGRPLRWEEINVLTAAGYAAKPKLRWEDLGEDAYRRPKGAVLPGKPPRLRPNHAIWTIEDVLRGVLGIHEGLKSSRKLWNYMVGWGLDREYALMDIYAIALIEAADTVNRQKLKANKPSWLDNEFATRYLHTTVRLQGWRLAYDIASSRQGWGALNYKEAQEDGKELPTIGQLNDGVLVGGNGSKRSAPGVDGDDGQGVGEAYQNRVAAGSRKRGIYERTKSELELAADQRARDHARIHEQHGTEITSHTVLPRDQEAIREERAHWSHSVGSKGSTPIGIPCHNGPFMGSDKLEFWDKERQAAKYLAELPSQQRRIALFRLAGYSNEQIAYHCGLSKSAVSSHASEANKRLHEFAEGALK
jgi:DNA-directed RNA polymerase specialized sigma24 family protein